MRINLKECLFCGEKTKVMHVTHEGAICDNCNAPRTFPEAEATMNTKQPDAEQEGRKLTDPQRMWDLLRYERACLLDNELITEDEYAELAQDHAAVARLEADDAARASQSGMVAALENLWVKMQKSPSTEVRNIADHELRAIINSSYTPAVEQRSGMVAVEELQKLLDRRNNLKQVVMWADEIKELIDSASTPAPEADWALVNSAPIARFENNMPATEAPAMTRDDKIAAIDKMTCRGCRENAPVSQVKGKPFHDLREVITALALGEPCTAKGRAILDLLESKGGFKL
jgi:hypothetical protein